MKKIFLFILVVALSQAEDSCPSVQIVGVGDSDKLTILRGCPGMHGLPGPKGDSGAPGENGEKGDSGQPGKLGPTGEKGENGSPGVKGEPGVTGAQGEKGSPGVKGEPGVTGAQAAKNCKDLKDKGVILTGWYTIYPDGMKPLMVLCDMHTDGGGWIVFQRRVDGSVDFFQGWQAYKTGFGSQLSEFWLGNENIHRLTAIGSYELRVDLQDFDYNTTYAKYSRFKLKGEKDLYRLQFQSFLGGTAGDSLMIHNNMAFTTKDKDNDKSEKTNCAELYKGAWWYEKCHTSNLNSLYLRGEHKMKGEGVLWNAFRGSLYSHKVSEMKFRPEK